jgi:hypothetical protein
LHFEYGQLNKCHRQDKTARRHPSETKIDHDLGSNPADLATPAANETSADSLASGSRAPEQGIPLAYDTKALPANLPDLGPTHSPNSTTSTILSLPFALSHQMFYDNLLFASSSKPSPDVEELINYHDSRPDFHSPETYNICIDFAINHEQYNAANRLFDNMTKAEIYFDSTTCQLLVRLHARQYSDSALDASDRPILRKGSTSVMKMLSVIRDSDPESEPEEFLRHILDCLRPVFSGWEVHPKVVKAALYSLVKKDLTPAAAELASTYFSSLPKDIDEETKDQCLDMIHLLLNINPRGGLSALSANHKLLIALLKTHPSFQPSPKTLFLLLSPLKRTKKPGSMAMRVMQSFRKTWGDGVVDDRVRLRVLKFAKKEGRLEIVEKMRS